MSRAGGQLGSRVSVLLLCLCAAPVSAAEPKVEVCLSAPGFSEDVTSAIGRILADRLRAHQVVQVTGMTGSGPGVCCLEKRCLRAAAQAGLRGVLEIQVVRFGPLVRISLKAHQAREAKEVVQIKSSATAKGFPGSAKTLDSDLDRGLASLGIESKPPPAPVRPRPEQIEKAPSKPKPRRDPPPAAGKPRPSPAPVAEGGDGPLSVEGRASDRRPTYFWTGGSLAAGGAVLAVVGIYMLAGPLQDALDRRRWARDAWLDATNPTDMDRYYDKMMSADDRARRDNLIGWLGVGAGATLAVTGALVMLLAPEPPREAPAPAGEAAFLVAPRLGPNGAGMSVGWTF